jgi:uncharacterized protein YcnI
MFKWIKTAFTKGVVKIKYLAYDDSVPEGEIEPYEDIASLEYEGEYDEFVMKLKLRKFVRLTKNHLVVEMTVVERQENGKIIE